MSAVTITLTPALVLALIVGMGVGIPFGKWAGQSLAEWLIDQPTRERREELQAKEDQARADLAKAAQELSDTLDEVRR